ncbi:hypothetical protein SRABI84_00927 [Peribacillus simplex]|nr:hypothetical protein SRABI84_00927 [Peribacillus simplex]
MNGRSDARMLNDKKKKLTPIQQEHQQVQTQLEIKMSVMTGGIIYTIGQVIPNFHILYHDFTDLTAGNPMAGILIFIAMFLTGFGCMTELAALFRLQVSAMPLYPQP